MEEREGRALDELADVVQRLAARVSAERGKQLRWVRGEVHRAVEGGLLPEVAAGTLADLYRPDVLGTFLAAADADELRGRKREATAGPSGRSARHRREVLGLLAREAGIKATVPRLVAPPARELLTAEQVEHVWRFVASEPWRLDPRSARHRMLVRLCALVAVVLDTGARSGALVSMETADVAEDLSTATVGEETFVVSERTRRALRSWLSVRADMVARLAGTPPRALWVTVHGGGRREAGDMPPITGTPLAARTVQEQYAAATRRANGERHAEPGWVMLPRRLDLLRRSANPLRAEGGTGAPVPPENGS